MKNWMLELIQGTDGSPSTMRVGVLLVLVAVLFNDSYLTVATGVDHTDWQKVALILGALGFKAVQRKFEGKSPSTPLTNTDTTNL